MKHKLYTERKLVLEFFNWSAKSLRGLTDVYIRKLALQIVDRGYVKPEDCAFKCD